MSAVLNREFYTRQDVVRIARELLGKVLVSEIDGFRTSGIITETEAYAGIGDRASHAFGGRRTARTEVMYADGGTAYVYLCYGMHHLFNVVTHEAGTPHAVLVRAMEPLEGIEAMRARREGKPLRTGGPALVSTALGIRTAHSGLDLLDGPIRIEDRGYRPVRGSIIAGQRIGVDYAGADALLPYRFRIAPSSPLIRKQK
ncbi:MAG: DNA-3-methyladenine glycosylase [Flavobacteriales bacterium]|nr:DNA-3-methyladenine glycosylase [Flavobacteriales bacterium]